MANLEFSFFCNILERGMNGILPIDETIFFFDDDSEKKQCCILYEEKYNEILFDAYCDYPPEGGWFNTVDKLVNTPLFKGQSIKDRWDHILVHHIGGYPTRRWLASWTNWPKEKIAQVYQHDADDILKLLETGHLREPDLARWERGALIGEFHTSTDLEKLRKISQILEMNYTEYDLKLHQRNNEI
ncbi:hypothetical protein [Anaerovibrio lipolyticus]|uniref:hypothetical protein n=1 Tax=Anaerovibrio lipolyticus TaxID=82374 RepID=UPI000482EDDD|nr:hypothetical protein [Anaerovibrio lipolyticus]